ncbi:uncharacterized protein LOC134222153 [Armigeres subalbatus]|uniref:uncharacterized protein LOC134222153 n=1 Tax=Armigeres subalbatus TaxID=124917 RepID=UPI002ED60DBA
MTPTTSTNRKTPAMKTLKTTLRSLLNMFQDICGFADNLSGVKSASQVTVRLEKLDELWENVNDVILNIETHDDYDEEEDNCSKQRSEFSSKYYDLKSLLLDKVKEFQEPPALNQSTRNLEAADQATMERVRLPQIVLQTFDGNIDDWLSFRDLYLSLIHRKADLPEVEKFHYLKGCLAGEAKSLVDPLPITRENYQVAWDSVMKRYNDSKQLKRRQVQALFKLPKLAKESATELRSLLEGFERSMQTLDQLVQPVEYKDLLLLDVLCARLDPITRRSWEELSSTKEQDTIKDLTDFLQRRVKVLAALPTKSSSYKEEPPQQKRAPFRHLSYTTVQRERWGCVACQEDHPLYQCPRFQRMSIPDRTKVLRDNGLCRNCFRHGHWAVDCSSPYTCRNCRGKHHTLVCSLTPSNGSRNGSPTLRAPAASRSTHSERPTTQGGTPAQVSSNVTGTKVSSILLATAVILVEGNNGDSGFKCNFMIEKLAQQLKVQSNGRLL